jgi:hypothetical protein
MLVFLCLPTRQSSFTESYPSRVLRHVQYNKLIYAEDILVLNEANRDTSPIVSGVPRLYGIAKRAGRLCGGC